MSRLLHHSLKSFHTLVTLLVLLIAYEGVKYREARHHLRHHAD